MARDVVGIDLGTTNTVVFRFHFVSGVDIDECDEPHAVPITYPDYHGYPVRNSNSLPSVLYLEEGDNGDYTPFTGDIAQQLMTANPNHGDNLLFNTKRLMVGDEQVLAGGYTAQRVAEEFYRICLHSFRTRFPRIPLRQVCVTRPAAFDPFGINSTTDAAFHALRQSFPDNTPELSALEEPQAALLSYLYNKLKTPEEEEWLLRRQVEKDGILTFAVVDIGGGTTDVTIQPLRISGSRGDATGDTYLTEYTIKFLNRPMRDGRHAESNPNVAFGGLDFDEEVSKHLYNRLVEKCREQNIFLEQHLTRAQRDALRKYATMRAKEYKEGDFSRSTQPSASWHPPLDNFGISQCVEVTFTRQEYEAWVEPLCGGSHLPPHRDDAGNEKPSVYSFVKKTLNNSGYQASDLDCIYVTGGMSWYQGVRNMIQREYGGQTEVLFSPQPLLDIACGAALYNSYFKVERDQVALNSSIMVDRPSGEPIVLASKEGVLPQEGSATGLRTTNPIEMTVNILRGASPISPDLARIKTLRCKLPGNRMTAIDTPVDISYKVTEEQRITLTLHVQDKQGPYDLVLNANNSGSPENTNSLAYWREINDFSADKNALSVTDQGLQQHYFLYKDLEQKRVLYFKNRFEDLQKKQAQPLVYERTLSEALRQWKTLMDKGVGNVSPLEPFLFALKLYDGILTDELGGVREEYLEAIARTLLPYWDPHSDRDNKFIHHILLTWNWPQTRAVVIAMYAMMPHTDPVVEYVLRERLHNMRDSELAFNCLLRHSSRENLRALLRFMMNSMSGSVSSRDSQVSYVTDSMRMNFQNHFSTLTDDQRQDLLSFYDELEPQHGGKIRYFENLFHKREKDGKLQKLSAVFLEYDHASEEARMFLRREWDPTKWDHQQLCRSIGSKKLLDEIVSRLESGNLPEAHRVGVLYWMSQAQFPPAGEYIRQKQKALQRQWEESGQYPYQWMEYSLARNRMDHFPDWQSLAQAFFTEGKGRNCAREFRRRARGSGRRLQDALELRVAVTELGQTLVIPPVSEEQKQQLRQFFTGVKELYQYPFCVDHFPAELDDVLARAMRYAPENDMALLDILVDVLVQLAVLETRTRFYNMLLELYNNPTLLEGQKKKVYKLCRDLYAEGG